jgi:pimeloyl-ACP methyl ester carboxylesterase
MSTRFCIVKPISIAVVFIGLWAQAALASTHEDIYFDVSLRQTGSATIHADVFNNPEAWRGVLTILAVHGMAERGSMFEPLADAIYADPVLKYVVKRIISLDMVAHGLSSAPTLLSPTLFGDLLIEDNASVVIQAIDILRARGLGPQVVMGHSMGGITIQTAQEMLLAQGSSLAAHSVYSAIMIASVPARGTVWTRLPGGDMTPFIRYDPVLGEVLDIPAAGCNATGAFTSLATGTLVPDAPTVATCIANDWIGIEPLTTILEMVGTYCQGSPDDPASTGLCRPLVRKDAFALKNGTLLMVLSFSEDVLTPAVDQDKLYTYLTGLPSTGLTLYRPIVADDAVHSMYIANPKGLIAHLRAVLY